MLRAENNLWDSVLSSNTCVPGSPGLVAIIFSRWVILQAQINSFYFLKLASCSCFPDSPNTVSFECLFCTWECASQSGGLCRECPLGGKWPGPKRFEPIPQTGKKVQLNVWPSRRHSGTYSYHTALHVLGHT